MVAVWLVLAVVSSLTFATPAVGQPSSACPEMTDSIKRLYMAYFVRDPNATEAFFWTNKYMNGEASLPSIADDLARSRDFEDRYGQRSSADFVELIYRNTGRPAPTDSELEHWTTALNTGYSRGRMVLALSESEAFVDRTETARPMAGYLRWYPPGTHWYCGRGSRSQLSIKPLTGQTVFADHLFRNRGSEADSVRLATIEGGLANAVMTATTLQPSVTDFHWNGLFSGDGFYGDAVDITAQPTTSWVVVFYPRSIGRDRLGWQIAP